ncbi:MAG TPA: hypothetical protein VFK05_02710 [Polyangiaceae bacterium]|nr:hypothetical protein [Polyangiaceae bacterium]
MSPPEHEIFTRLRDESGSLEQELLRSADADRPARGTREATLAALRSRTQRDFHARSRRLAVAVAALTLAAGAVLLVRDRVAPPRLRAEPPAASHVSGAAPAPSTAPAPSPLDDCAPAAVGSGQQASIDDFEDGDGRLLVIDKRAGTWIVFNDGSGQQKPLAGSAFRAERIPGGRGASLFGLHTSGSKFSKWGAVLGVELAPRRCYDASAYAGVVFWARGRATLRVGVKMTQVVAEEFGGSCVQDCYDSHGAVRALSKDWQHYEVRWEELRQSGFGMQLAFDPHSLLSIEFVVGANQPPFDYWIDDLSFLTR